MKLWGLFSVTALMIWAQIHAPHQQVRTPASQKLIKGYNIAWWGKAYGHQWIDGSFSKKKVDELLDHAVKGDAKIVRLWLFEGIHQTQFEKNEEGFPATLHKSFIPNVLYFLKKCRQKGLKANLTFFDGNAYKAAHLTDGRLRSFWWNVLNDKYQMGEWFLNQAITPLLDAIKDEDLDSTIAQIELMNEIDAAVKYKIFENGWSGASKMLCQWQKVIKNYHHTYGVSVGHSGSEKHFINEDLPYHCSDYFDFHVYSDSGKIPACEWFSSMSQKGMRFQLGEFGQKSQAFDDQLQAHLTKSFLTQAKECGFESALAWRLEDIRPGHNREARHSYIAFDELRPAWYALRDFEKGTP